MLKTIVLCTTRIGRSLMKICLQPSKSGRIAEQFRNTNMSSVQNQLIYYQWAPFIMAIEAGFFYIPGMLYLNCRFDTKNFISVVIWGQLSGYSGMNVTKLVETAQKAESASVGFKKSHIYFHSLRTSFGLRFTSLNLT